MSDPTLLKHYHNLLITLCREYVEMIGESSHLRELAEAEKSPGRKSGLYCQSKVIKSCALNLKSIIQRNKIALQQLFQTTNVVTISQQSLR